MMRHQSTSNPRYRHYGYAADASAHAVRDRNPPEDHGRNLGASQYARATSAGGASITLVAREPGQLASLALLPSVALTSTY